MNKLIDANSYQAIIFDLGGVLLNIDYQASKLAFEKLGVLDFDRHFSQLSQSKLFDKFETGLISAADFRNEIKKESNINCSDEHLDAAWNAMLLDFPTHRIELLENLSKNTTLYLFSNTNDIHITVFLKLLESLGLKDRFENVFHKIYYSYELGKRKPNSASFTFILNQNNLLPSKTLFIDDSAQHIEGAKKAGLQCILLEATMDVTNLFKND